MRQESISVEFANAVGYDILLGGRHQGYIVTNLWVKFIRADTIGLDNNFPVVDEKRLTESYVQKTQTAGSTKGAPARQKLYFVIRL